MVFQEIVKSVLDTDAEDLSTLTLKTTGPADRHLRYVSQGFMKAYLTLSGRSVETVPGVASNSDLLPGVYEGGFKVWESTKDLIELVEKKAIDVVKRDVLDVS